MGGEKRCLLLGTGCKGGSPPHGRGKVWSGEKKPLTGRITPAWAGKSCRGAPAATLPQDHPRMGGEKSAFVYYGRCRVGSPPHGRGKGNGAAIP